MITRPWLGIFWVWAGIGLVGQVQAADKWIKLEAPDFTLMSDAREKDVVEFAKDYAAFREAARQLFERPGVATPRSILVLHKRYRDFAMYAQESKRDGFKRFSASTYVDGRAATGFALDGNRADTIRLTSEFETMWLLGRYGWSLPTWAAQGTGMVLSTTFVDKAGQVVVGKAVPSAPTWFSERMLSWDRFFEVSRGSAEYTGEKDRGKFHPQAWGLMHWLLLSDEAGRARFFELAERLASGSAIDAVEAVSGVAQEDLTKTIMRHLRGTPPRRAFLYDPEKMVASFVITSLPEVERLAILSELAASEGKTQLADALYYQALALDPNSATTLEASARWYRRHGDMGTAVDKYREAIEHGSTNATAYLTSADWRIDRLGGMREGGGIPLVLGPARTEVDRALELDPGMGEAYVQLGRIAFLTPAPEEALVARLSTRVGPDVWGLHVRYYRGLLLNRLGRRAEAVADLRVVVRSSETPLQLRELGEGRLDDIQLVDLREQVKKELQARRFDEARELVENWTDADGQRDATQGLQKLTDMIDRNEKSSAQERYNRDVARINRLLEARKFDQALEMAKGRESGATSEVLKQAYGDIRRQIEANVGYQKMKMAMVRKNWELALELGENFLATQPEDQGMRPKVLDAMKEIQAAMAAEPVAP